MSTAKKTYELTDAEQRDLITLIQQGKPLPEKYRTWMKCKVCLFKTCGWI